MAEKATVYCQPEVGWMETDRIEAIATILASVVNADHKVRSAEISAAHSLLDLIASQKADLANDQFHDALDHPNAEKMINQLKAFAQEANTAERYELVRNCWYIAGSDMEIHESEAELIFRISDYLGVSRSDCLVAKKSCTSA